MWDVYYICLSLLWLHTIIIKTTLGRSLSDPVASEPQDRFKSDRCRTSYPVISLAGSDRIISTYPVVDGSIMRETTVNFGFPILEESQAVAAGRSLHGGRFAMECLLYLNT